MPGNLISIMHYWRSMARRHPLIILWMIGAFLCLSLLPAHLHVYHAHPGEQTAVEHGVHAHFALDAADHTGEHRHVVDTAGDTLVKKSTAPLEPAAALLLVLLLLLPLSLLRSHQVPTRSVVTPYSPPAVLRPPLRAPPRS